MKDRATPGIGAERQLQDWADIDWTLVEKRVRNLRRRIFRATRSGEWKQVRNLQKLMLRSFSNLLHSVRKVTQHNKGRRTPGIDRQLVLTPKARAKLVNQMLEYEAWKVRPARRIYIPKANGKQRPLGILTIKNRVAQAVVKNALEPSWEARFETNSYGFRPGRSCHDAIAQCWKRLNRNSTHRWALDADIAAAFDNICQMHILDRIGNVPGRELIKQWLKAGFVEAEVLRDTTVGVQQGGVISPVLANVALDGLESILARQKAGYIRYADDLVVTAKSKEAIEALLPTIQGFFAERGLALNPEKTRIVHVKDGFNFLGFNVRSYNNKCIIKPEKGKVLAKLREIREWLKKNRTARTEDVIRHLNPVLRGWANYYKRANSKVTFAYFDHQVWCALWRWCVRRHPKKNKLWIRQRYFKRVNTREWTFFCTARNSVTGEQLEMHLMRISSMRAVRHVKVRGDASPDDPILHDYWMNRAARSGWTREELETADGSGMLEPCDGKLSRTVLRGARGR